MEFARFDGFVMEVEEPIQASKGKTFPLSPSVQPHQEQVARGPYCFSIRKAGSVLAAKNPSESFTPISQFHIVGHFSGGIEQARVYMENALT